MAAKKTFGLPGLRGLVLLRGLLLLLRSKIENVVVLRGEVVVGESGGGRDVDIAAVAGSMRRGLLAGVGLWFWFWAPGERARTSS